MQCLRFLQQSAEGSTLNSDFNIPAIVVVFLARLLMWKQFGMWSQQRSGVSCGGCWWGKVCSLRIEDQWDCVGARPAFSLWVKRTFVSSFICPFSSDLCSSKTILNMLLITLCLLCVPKVTLMDQGNFTHWHEQLGTNKERFNMDLVLCACSMQMDWHIWTKLQTKCRTSSVMTVLSGNWQSAQCPVKTVSEGQQTQHWRSLLGVRLWVCRRLGLVSHTDVTVDWCWNLWVHEGKHTCCKGAGHQEQNTPSLCCSLNITEPHVCLPFRVLDTHWFSAPGHDWHQTDSRITIPCTGSQKHQSRDGCVWRGSVEGRLELMDTKLCLKETLLIKLCYGSCA